MQEKNWRSDGEVKRSGSAKYQKLVETTARRPHGATFRPFTLQRHQSGAVTRSSVGRRRGRRSPPAKLREIPALAFKAEPKTRGASGSSHLAGSRSLKSGVLKNRPGERHPELAEQRDGEQGLPREKNQSSQSAVISHSEGSLGTSAD